VIGGVPSWYQVRLADGTSGFASKAWSRVYGATGPAVLRLGAWNIKKLGHGDAKDYSLVAQLISDNFDLLAVVEVMQKSGGHPGFDSLISELGPNWEGLVTSAPRPNTGVGHAEFYAVVFRKDAVRPCDGWHGLRYHQDGDGSDGGISLFDREPAFACFVSEGAALDNHFDFLLGAYHATWSDGDTDMISQEVSHLLEVFPTMAAAAPGERDLLLIGDFNLVPADLHETTLLHSQVEGEGSTLNSSGEMTTNLYDHLIIHDPDATTELVGRAAVLDLRHQAAPVKEFYRTVSDHLPIYAEFFVGRPDDD
jgi:hypothetical protein